MLFVLNSLCLNLMYNLRLTEDQDNSGLVENQEAGPESPGFYGEPL